MVETDQQRLSRILADDLQPRIDYFEDIEDRIEVLEAGGGVVSIDPPYTDDGATLRQLHVTARAGQTVPLFDLKDENGADVVALNQDGSGLLGALGKLSSGALPFSNGAGIFNPVSTIPTDGGWYSFGYFAGGPDFTLSRADGQGSFAELFVNYVNLDLANSVAQTQGDYFAQAQDATSSAKAAFGNAAGNTGISVNPGTTGSNGPAFDGTPNAYTNLLLQVNTISGIHLLMTDTSSTIWARAQPGQTVPLLDLRDENGVDIFTVGPDSATAVTAPGGGSVNPFAVNVDMINGPFGLTVDPTGGIFVWGGLGRPAVFQVQPDNRSTDTFQQVFAANNHLSQLIFTCVENGEVVVRGVGDIGLTLGGPQAEPADGLLSASEVTFWIDDTPGATKLKLKAKDSGGTVRTGEVALT